MKLAPAGHHGAGADRGILRRHGGRPQFTAYLPGGASGGILPASMDDIPLDFGTLEKYGCFIGSAAVVVFSRPGRHPGRRAEPDALLRGRELRPMHAVPVRHAEGAHADGTRHDWDAELLDELAPGHARRLDLRAGPGGEQPADLRACATSPKLWRPRRPPNEQLHHARRARRTSTGTTTETQGLAFELDGEQVYARGRARASGTWRAGSAPRSRISATVRSRAIGPTATAAPAWWRSRASACWPHPASACRPSA